VACVQPWYTVHVHADIHTDRTAVNGPQMLVQCAA